MKTTRTIILLIAACLALLPGSLVSAQNKKLDVQGTVTDAKGDALVGAMVYVKGSSTGTMTDAAGKFKLVGVASNASLVASLIATEGCLPPPPSVFVMEGYAVAHTVLVAGIYPLAQ